MRRWRWVVAAAVVLGAVAIPFVVDRLPAGHSAIGARALLARVNDSARVPYSGYAQSTGGLALPAGTDDFGVNDLLGATTRLRVWWRGSADWRVDSIDATGETDVHHAVSGTWTWNYEQNEADHVDSKAPAVRLPRADDLVPGDLARRLLSEADPADVIRLPDARIAGQDAAGLRLRVTDPRSTLDRVDVWAVPNSGLPLRVAVYGADPRPVVTTTMYDLDTATPAASITAFHPSSGASVEFRQAGNIVSALDQFGRSTPPRTLAGLPRRTDLRLGAVGVYGRGVTLLVAIPLPGQFADSLVPQLSKTPGAVQDSSGIAIGIGPVNLQLSAPAQFGNRWLLVGTLTARALHAAVGSLPPPRGFGFPR
jgi:hypothetical protein